MLLYDDSMYNKTLRSPEVSDLPKSEAPIHHQGLKEVKKALIHKIQTLRSSDVGATAHSFLKATLAKMLVLKPWDLRKTIAKE
jgi:hypothetical protein